MKKYVILLFIFSALFIIGCNEKEEETTEDNEITAQVYKVDEIIEEELPEPEEEIVTVKLCHDTDNSFNQWTPGRVFGYYDNAQRFEFRDECKDQTFVLEFYCENEEPKQDIYLCTNGCVDGACL